MKSSDHAASGATGLGATGVQESLVYIQRLAADGFYGTLELRFEAGNVVHLVEHRSLKPLSLQPSDKPRIDHEEEAEGQEEI
jgi:hypothetical protein